MRITFPVFGSAESCPIFHEVCTLLKGSATAIGSLCVVTDEMREASLGDLTRKRRAIPTPIAEGASETVHGGISAEPAQNHPQRI